MNPANPCIVQSDRTVLVEVNNPRYAEARDQLALFAELEKSPEHIHTYRITPLSIWNAAAAGMPAERMIDVLRTYSKFPVPETLCHEILELASRYGRLVLERQDVALVLRVQDDILARQLAHHGKLRGLLGAPCGPRAFHVELRHRGEIKRALTQLGFPVKDLAGYTAGAPHPIALRTTTASGQPFALRPYQRDAVDNFYQGGGVEGGCGVVVLPCGAGKTIVGMAVMARLQVQTLIVTANITALRQWRDELLDKTTLQPADIGEYSGEQKTIAPITLATYQILTYRPDKSKDYFPHYDLFYQRDWGLIIYDEVHLLPAPVFRITADLQSRRRLGLTATLVREDGREVDVFSLVGPKRYDMPWKELEARQWLAVALCTELRVPLDERDELEYAVAGDRQRFRIASENPRKLAVVRGLLTRHAGGRVLIIGQYLAQLRHLARELRAPLITGQTPQSERERLYAQFRSGNLPVLIVSKVGNFAIDLPDANVAIQVSGTFGSRQEEAQRLGRILRPKPGDNHAYFYTIVSHNTCEQEFALKRQLFLTEQGYRYAIEDVEIPPT
ncbi:MAG: DEAD/DEAH box helicase [bacterium]|nr:DEAD/DEAH box helicase [bacterium]